MNNLLLFILLNLDRKLEAFYRSISNLRKILLLIAVSFTTMRIVYFIVVGGEDKRRIFTEILAIIGAILLIYLSEDIVNFIARIVR